MGACCSHALDTLPPSTKSFARITDAELQLRIPSTSLTPQQQSALIEASHFQSYQSFTRSMLSLINPDSLPLESKEFTQRISEARESAVETLRSQFRQGTEGEGVPFSQIKLAEDALRLTCSRESAVFAYCNTYRSFALCSKLKHRLIEEELLPNGTPNKAKLLRSYDKVAAGCYSHMCRNDLESLIDQSSKLDAASLIALLRKQTVADREILRKEKSSAEAVSKRRAPEGFGGGEEREEGGETYAVLQSRLSVLDIIDRLPEEDRDLPCDPYPADAYFTQQEEATVIVPFRKHHSAEYNPHLYFRREPFTGEEGSTLTTNSQCLKAEKFEMDGEDSTADGDVGEMAGKAPIGLEIR